MDGRRELILEAADRLLGEAGLEGLTIRRMLTLTGLSRRAFYDIFPTKDELMLALFTRILELAAKRLAPAQAAAIAPEKRLELFIHAIVSAEPRADGADAGKSIRRGAAFSREHLRLAQTRPADLERALGPLLALLQGIIADGAAEGRWVSDSPAQHARFIYNLVSSTIHGKFLGSAAEDSQPSDMARLASELTLFCANALQAK